MRSIEVDAEAEDVEAVRSLSIQGTGWLTPPGIQPHSALQGITRRPPPM